MIPNLKLTVKYDNGGSSNVDVKPRTQIAFERKFDLSMTEAFTDQSLRFEWLYFMAWHASKTSVEFDEWMETVEGIDMEVDGTDADPTSPVPSAGS